MRSTKRRGFWSKGVLACAVGLMLAMLAPGAAGAAAGPGWEIDSSHYPTNIAPGGSGTYVITITNTGSAPTDGSTVTITDTLPPGLTATSIMDAGFGAYGFSCDLPTLTCTRTNPLAAGFVAQVSISVTADPGASGAADNAVEVSGGGASAATALDETTISAVEPRFGVEAASFVAKAQQASGAWETQAGGHPYSATTRFDFNTSLNVRGFEGQLRPVGSVKKVSAELPPGFVGNPQATPTCSLRLFVADPGLGGALCPTATQVGVVTLGFALFGTTPFVQGPYPVYNLEAGSDEPALFGFSYNNNLAVLRPHLRADGDYGITVDVSNISQGLPVISTALTLWGVPADSGHDPLRFAPTGKCTTPTFCEKNNNTVSTSLRPFLTNPTTCDQVSKTLLRVGSWESPEPLLPAIESPAPLASGCDRLSFNPSVRFGPTATEAESPSGLDVHIHVPQNEDPNGVATPALKKAVVTLPDGISVNPSSADGLGGCAPAEIKLRSDAAPTCPDSSNLGTVSVGTPLLEKPLSGNIYLAKQGDNPFGTLLSLYLVVEGPGIVIKLPGRVEPDLNTGRITAVFDDNPRLPFEDLHLAFKSGPRAALITPGTCGTKTTTAALTPWGGPTAERTSSFEITSGPNGSSCPNNDLRPKLNAGTASPVGGTSSNFNLRLSRDDATQRFTGLDLSLPKGLTAKLAGVPYCPDSVLGSYPSPAVTGTGAAELASPKCPAASQVGTAIVGAGAGSNPFYVKTGKAYLAGPYKGQTLSLAIVTPAVAGPFDLGTVVVRSAIHVDPATAKISVASDPIPTILEGIPLDVRDIRVSVDRNGFMRNPTSCDPMSIDATVRGAQGATANVSNRFQVASCERLAFKPKLHLRLFGGTKRGMNPRFRAVLTQKEGEANIDKVSVALPHSEFLDNDHIKTICTRVQYAAKACPKGSIYGYAKAFSPLLDEPLQGPVYLRSSSNLLPDLVASLDGQIHIDLAGKIDSVNGGIRNTFSVIPDAPVSKFILTMQGGKKGLLVNSRNLCKSVNRATVKMDGQNGKIHDFRPVLRRSCKGAKRAG